MKKHCCWICWKIKPQCDRDDGAGWRSTTRRRRQILAHHLGQTGMTSAGIGVRMASMALRIDQGETGVGAAHIPDQACPLGLHSGVLEEGTGPGICRPGRVAHPAEQFAAIAGAGLAAARRLAGHQLPGIQPDIQNTGFSV